MKPHHWKFLALYSSYVVALHLVPGPWRSWKVGRAGRLGPVDLWSLTHVVWGVIAVRLGLNQADFMKLGAVNELVEAGIRATRPDLLWGSPETLPNVAADLAANWLGFKLGEALAKPGGLRAATQ